MCETNQDYIEMTFTNKAPKSLLGTNPNLLEIEMSKYLRIDDFEDKFNPTRKIRKAMKKRRTNKENKKSQLEHTSSFTLNSQYPDLEGVKPNTTWSSHAENLNLKQNLNYPDLNKCGWNEIEREAALRGESGVTSVSTVDTLRQEESISLFDNFSSYYMCIKPVVKKVKSNFCPNLKRLINNNNMETFPNKRLLPADFLNDIYRSLLKEETKICAKQYENILQIQKDINEKMRAVLIDWLIEVHQNFKLVPETLFLSINIIDTYLSRKCIEQNNLQLLGVTSLWLACKYEEVSVPLIRDCEYITANAYTAEQIKAMENDILKTLHYDITFPSVLAFYDLLAVNFGFSQNNYYQGRYLMELFLLDQRITKYKPHLVACSVVYLVMKLNKENFPEYSLIKLYTFEDERTLKDCSKDICYLLEKIEDTNLKSVKSKFSTAAYLSVAQYDTIKQCKQ